MGTSLYLLLQSFLKNRYETTVEAAGGEPDAQNGPRLGPCHAFGAPRIRGIPRVRCHRVCRSAGAPIDSRFAPRTARGRGLRRRWECAGALEPLAPRSRHVVCSPMPRYAGMLTVVLLQIGTLRSGSGLRAFPRTEAGSCRQHATFRSEAPAAGRPRA